MTVAYRRLMNSASALHNSAPSRGITVAGSFDSMSAAVAEMLRIADTR